MGPYDQMMYDIDEQFRKSMVGIRGIHSSLLFNTGEKRMAFDKILENLKKMTEEIERLR